MKDRVREAQGARVKTEVKLRKDQSKNEVVEDTNEHTQLNAINHAEATNQIDNKA